MILVRKEFLLIIILFGLSGIYAGKNSFDQDLTNLEQEEETGYSGFGTSLSNKVVGICQNIGLVKNISKSTRAATAEQRNRADRLLEKYQQTIDTFLNHMESMPFHEFSAARKADSTDENNDLYMALGLMRMSIKKFTPEQQARINNLSNRKS